VAIQKTQAVLLSKRYIRETSAIAVFYTEGFGKIKGLVKGVRGPEARFGLYLQEFAKYDIVYYEKRRAETYMVTQCDLKDANIEIANDLYRRLKAYYVLELVDKFTPLEEASADIYNLLDWILESIRKERFIDRQIIVFRLKLLEYSGFLPQLESCVNCSKAVSKDARFSVRMSGLLCSDCEGLDAQALRLSKGAVATVNMIRRHNIDQLGRSNINTGISKELEMLLERFIAYHLGEHLKTQEFIKQVFEQGVI